MKAYTKKSHVRESANDKIFGFVISLILILFAVITAIPLISEVADFGFFHSVGCGDSIITKCFNGISVVENRIPTVQIYYVICGIYYGVCCS